MKLHLLAIILLGIAANYYSIGYAQSHNQITEIKIVKDSEYVDEAPDVLPEYPGA